MLGVNNAVIPITVHRCITHWVIFITIYVYKMFSVTKECQESVMCSDVFRPTKDFYNISNQPEPHSGEGMCQTLSLCLVLPLLSCPYLAVPGLVSFLLVN